MASRQRIERKAPTVKKTRDRRPNRGWTTTKLTSVQQVLDVLLELKGKRWLSRGQPEVYGTLEPSINRYFRGRSRADKLGLERQAIDLFRHTARFFSDEGEKEAMRDDFIALMVLRHYGFPTRLLDWSMSPYVAAYFAVSEDESERQHADGEIWSFDEAHYETIGARQWVKWPETTIGNPARFDAGLTAFLVEEPPDWVIATFYPTDKFPRQFAQNGAYTMTARFDRDHADALRSLLEDNGRCHRYVIDRGLKRELRHVLRVGHGVWRGALVPDAAGAVETAKMALLRHGSR
jgi:FRG domain